MDVLEGIRVIDVSMWAFVPAAGAVLGHWGADVIKVESPGHPDPLRALGGGGPLPGDAGYLFKHYSRGKRAIALDLTREEGRDILYRLAAGADVFLTSHLPETRRKLKFDVDDIRAVSPNIIYARGSGHGPQGPDAGRGGYDAATWWCRGSLADSAMTMTGADRPPGMVGHGDGMSGMTLAGGICAALVKRALSGQPSIVDGSLMGTAMWFNAPAIIASGIGQRWAGTGAARAAMHPTINSYRTGDGRFIMLLLLGDSDADWVDLCHHLGVPELGRDARFATSRDRYKNRADAVAALDEVFEKRTLEEWKAALGPARGVWAPVQTAEEMFDDPQTVANGFIGSVEYPGGPIRLPAPPILFDERAGDPPLAPDFGQHTDAILDELGLAAEDVARLRAAGVVA
jgi:crotonobetainyl-CoA:carnitine CoA-transferase CaiB-like acyl-CoA transferase